MAQDLRVLVGENVRRVREATGLTQAELSAVLGKDRAYISGLELGKRNVTIMKLHDIGAVLGVAVSEFFVGAEPPVKSGRRSTRGK